MKLLPKNRITSTVEESEKFPHASIFTMEQDVLIKVVVNIFAQRSDQLLFTYQQKLIDKNSVLLYTDRILQRKHNSNIATG